MSQLRDFQERFQRALLAGDDAVLEEIGEGAHESREVLLGLYRKSYLDRLVKMLLDDHELLHDYLGHERFYALGRAYVVANPSRDPLARCYARHLPQFLKETKPYSAHPEMTELALLEKSLKDAFYSEDAPVLQLADLASIPPEAWARLQFKPHASAARLDLTTNASSIWTALKNKKKRPAATHRQAAEPVLVWRQLDAGAFRVLSLEEATIWDRAAKGACFGELCEMISAHDAKGSGPARAATYLHSWITSGLLASAILQK